MKKKIIFLALTLSMLTASCGPAESISPFEGEWTANLGVINFTQSGDQLTGEIAGYGGFWNETFVGAVNGNEVSFSTEILGDIILVFDGDAFKTKSTGLALCGVRNSQELPAGCGFSGKWIVPSKHVFLPGTYMVLKQTGSMVSGDLYSESDTAYDSFTGEVEWGKGWRANGKSTQRGELSLWMNASETGFEFYYGSAPNTQELCAVRDGVSSAQLSSYYCEP